MISNPEELQHLNDRAREVGEHIGWRLEFIAAPNSEYVALTAGPDRTIILGPDKLASMAAHDIDLELDALERGDRQIVRDEDGDPRLH